MDTFKLMERQTLLAPLGLRFRDAATGASVTGGLNVTVYPATQPQRRVPAFPNRTGTYVLHHAPGLRALEQGAGDAGYWNTLPPRQPFIVEVIDSERRFLPFKFEARLPARGLYRWELSPQASPIFEEEESSVPLYSAPTRAVPPGMAVIRMDLWDALADEPATWALVEALMDAPPLNVRGFADERGRLALIFPYPEPPPLTHGSPLSSTPGGASLSFTQQSWPIRLEASYVPGNTVAALPDLRAILMQMERPADLWADLARGQPLTEIALRYGRELVVQSHDTTNGTALSKLLITPAGSPP
jgi:hypothetical protein